METKDIILELRTKKGLSQDELAEKVFVTRQAVSRWENGETIPNTETLKLLSELFDVSINTLLGAPSRLCARVVECRLITVILVTKKTVHPTRTIADGVMPTAILPWTFGNSMPPSAARKSSRSSNSNSSLSSTLYCISRGYPRLKI